MSKKITQQDLLVQHEQVFRLIILVSNQIIRQSQLTEILLKTNYCKNSTAVTRLLQKLEEFDLIKRFKEEATSLKSVQVTKTVLKFIQGPNAVVVKTSGVIRETKNAVRVELFKHYFLKENMTLDEVLKFATQDSVSNLFNSHDTFYDSLLANDLAFDSFNSKSSNFFLQKAEIEYVKQQQRQSLDKNLERGGAKKENKINSDYRRCWTLEKLASHQIYLVDSCLSNPIESEDNAWIKNHFRDCKSFEPKTLRLKFALVTISDSPNKSNLVKSLMHIYRYVYKTFKLHESYFIRKKNIKKAIVNVEVEIDIILLNDRAFKKLDRDDLLDWFKRKIRLRLRQAQTLESFKHNFNVNFLSMNVNPNNEHLQYKKTTI